VPRVQLDAAEVDHPRERRRVVDDREHRRVPARELDELLADEVGGAPGTRFWWKKSPSTPFG
jgi:hypothetical protein